MQLLKFAFCFLNCRREWVKIIYHHHGSPNREPTGSGELSSFILVSWISKWKLKCFRRTKQLLVLQCGYSLLLWMISYISFQMEIQMFQGNLAALGYKILYDQMGQIRRLTIILITLIILIMFKRLKFFIWCRSSWFQW